MPLPSHFESSDWTARFGRESEINEFKTGAGRKPLQEALVAMSNSSGGVIWIGVSDQGDVVGRTLDQNTEEAIHEAALSAVAVGGYRLSEVVVGETPVIAVDVRPRTDDVSQTSEGRVLTRRGPRNQAVFGRDLWNLLARRSRARFEDSDSGVSLDHVADPYASELAQAMGWSDPTDWRTRWTERGYVHESGNLTIAGALVMTDPALSLGAAKFHIDVRGYEHVAAHSPVRRDEIGGPVQRQVREATRLVLRDIGTDSVLTGSTRQDLPRIPPRVVREAVANAVAHRSYDDRSPVVIDIRPDTVTITSPGGLPSPVTVATLRQAQAPRNHTVIAALRRFDLAEDSGQGIDLIMDEMMMEMVAEPTFEATDASFAVRLPLRGLVTPTERAWLRSYERSGSMDDAGRAMVVEIIRHGRITNASARELVALDSTEIRARLQLLRDQGLVEQHGTRGSAYYTLGSLAPRRPTADVVLDLARTTKLTNAAVREVTGLTRDQARSLLRDLVDEGRLIRRGARRGSYYELP